MEIVEELRESLQKQGLKHFPKLSLHLLVLQFVTLTRNSGQFALVQPPPQDLDDQYVLHALVQHPEAQRCSSA